MEKFADNPNEQSTLRELHRLAFQPRFWASLAIAVVILAISGPFDTQNLLNLPQRLIYWALVAATTFFIGVGISHWFDQILQPAINNVWLRYSLGGLISGIPIAVWVWLINVYAFRFDMGNWAEFGRLTLYCMAIAACVSLAYFLIRQSSTKATEPGTDTAATSPLASPFFERLTKPIGRDLICLKAKDHYLEVTTAGGSDLILMRLADAERELAGIEGMRIHRSHWVARAAVTGTVRKNGQPHVVLADGTELPVSRSHVKKAREAGLI